MKFSEIKDIKELVDHEWRHAVEEITNGTDDFEAGNYRFIREYAIDQIQCDELSSDEYILGCFSTWLLADVLEMGSDVIEAMKEAEAFEAIGKLVISLDKVEDLQQEYVRHDGYGHHFAHYDHDEHEINNDYLAFRIN